MALRTSSHLASTLSAMVLLACFGSAPDGAAVPRSARAPTAAPPATAESQPALAAGAATGQALAAVSVPALEAGVRGLLQAVPRARTTSAAALARTWLDIKGEPDLRLQHRRLERARLDRHVGDGLIDLRALEGAGLPPFGSRDRVRGRTWVSRTMAAVLIEAWRRFHLQHPDARLTLGDLTQPGGGSISHNAIVRDLSGPEAEALVDLATLEAGDLVANEMRVAADFPAEIGRFQGPDDPVWLRHRLVARRDVPLQGVSVRAVTTRYTFPAAPSADELSRGFGEMAHIARRGIQVGAARVRQTAPDGTTGHVWRQHWVDPGSKRQLITVSRKKQRRRLQTKWIDEARVARWQKKKPGSLSEERRWVRAEDGTWTRWQAMREAGHLSHMDGCDADISFVTHGNRRHFALDLGVFDAARTWDWFLSLDAAARAVGTRIDVILLSRSVIRALERGLPKAARRTQLWRATLRRAPGHDAHHHLRLVQPTLDSEARARAVLAALSTPSAALGSAAIVATP